MDNPRAVTHPGQSPRDLRATYAGQQRGRSVRRHANKGWAGLKGAIGGVIVGLLTVLVFCLIDKQTFHWQAAAWEAAACGLAGMVLGRTNGGAIPGGVLFGLLYAGAMYVRGTKYNSIDVLEPYLPHLEMTMNGNFAMLTGAIVAGAFLGFLNSLK